MNIARRSTQTFRNLSARRTIVSLAAGASLIAAPAAFAQQPISSPATTLHAANTNPFETASLPDSPGAVLFGAKTTDSTASSSSLENTNLLASGDFRGGGGQASAAAIRPASRYDMYIAPGQSAPRLTQRDKVIAGIKDTFTPFTAVGWLISAGYSQGLDNSPNYGQDGKAFAQRLGAAAARASSENLFTESVLAPVLHEDARYYRMGGHNYLKRTVYAATRTVITRTDSGRKTLNIALLGGNLGGSYLTTAYYPAQNTTTKEVFQTFGGSIGGSAIGFVVSEFLSGKLNIFHSSKPSN